MSVGGHAPGEHCRSAVATGGTNSYGVYNVSSSPTVQGSSITGTTNSILHFFSSTVKHFFSSTVKVADTMLDGPAGGTGFTCVGAYTAAYVALNTTCT